MHLLNTNTLLWCTKCTYIHVDEYIKYCEPACVYRDKIKKKDQ